MISIVIPLYNKAQQVTQTLNSVLAQTFTEFEVIVVDDGSTDGSAEVVAQISDPRIKLIRQSNAGVSAARNRGIAEAKGEFIALLDADDCWKPSYLATQHSLTEIYKDCDVFAVGYEFVDQSGTTTPTLINHLSFTGDHGVLSNYFEVASCSHPPICSISVMARKHALEAIGGFPVGVATGEDLLTWARLACNYSIAYCKTPLAVYFLPSTGTLRKDPKDMSMKHDLVRRELIALLQASKPLGWRLYLSFWAKMRSVINLRKGERTEALRYAAEAISFNPANYKAYALMAGALLPHALTSRLLFKA